MRLDSVEALNNLESVDIFLIDVGRTKTDIPSQRLVDERKEKEIICLE